MSAGPGTSLTTVGGERVNVATGEVVSPARFDLARYLAKVASDEAVAQQRQLSAAYDRAVDALLGPNDVQVERVWDAREGREVERRFKKKSAWRKLARFFNLSVRIVSQRNDEHASEGGRTELVCEVIAAASAPWGQTMEAVGVCSTYETRFRGEKAYAKRYADCMATAQTRASNRCVSDLIAAGEVSAEEMEGADKDAGVESAGATQGTTGAPAPRPEVPRCPKCKGPMWDNRGRKRNQREPDFRCKDRNCLDEKGYVTAIFKWKPEEEAAPNAEGRESGNAGEASGATGTTPVAPEGAGPTTAAPMTNTATPTPSPTTNGPLADEDRRYNGERFGDMSTSRLSTLLTMARQSTGPRFAELTEVLVRVLERRTARGVQGPGSFDGEDSGDFDEAGADDDLPF